MINIENMVIKIAVNRKFGGFGLSEEAYKHLGLKWDGYGYAFDEDRTNPKLIECIETLGEKANGRHAFLEVIEIHISDLLEIDNYDGIETVRVHSRKY